MYPTLDPSGFRGSSPCLHQFLFDFGIQCDPGGFPEPTCQDCCPDLRESDSAADPRGWMLGGSLPALRFLTSSHKPPKKTSSWQLVVSRGAGGWQEQILGFWENPAFRLLPRILLASLPTLPHSLACWALQDVASLPFLTFFQVFFNFSFYLLHPRQPFPLA